MEEKEYFIHDNGARPYMVRVAEVVKDNQKCYDNRCNFKEKVQGHNRHCNHPSQCNYGLCLSKHGEKIEHGIQLSFEDNIITKS